MCAAAENVPLKEPQQARKQPYTFIVHFPDGLRYFAGQGGAGEPGARDSAGTLQGGGQGGSAGRQRGHPPHSVRLAHEPLPRRPGACTVAAELCAGAPRAAGA